MLGLFSFGSLCPKCQNKTLVETEVIHGSKNNPVPYQGCVKYTCPCSYFEIRDGSKVVKHN